MSKHQTNVEFVEEIMEFSKAGAMMQMFVIEALGKWADIIANMDIEELKEQFGDYSIVCPESWQATAKELQEKLNDKYGVNKA